MRVVGVARDGDALEELRTELGDGFVPEPADAADPSVAGRLIDAYEPRTLVLNAGTTPVLAPLQEQSWDTFRAAWETDVRQAFHWVRESLLRPLPSGSTVLSFSSGAAVNGSPLSGGYAGAKATVRFVSAYAADESARQSLGIRYVSVLPKLTPATGLGSGAVAAYAALQGVDVPTFLSGFGPTLTPELVAATVLDLVGDAGWEDLAYLLTPGGLKPL